MNFVIGKKFNKSLPIEKKENILKKMNYFTQQLLNVEGKIRELPSGFWVRRIKNTNIFKFRINSGDRILFSYESLILFGKKKFDVNKIIFLEFVEHDNQIIKGNKIEIDFIEIDETPYEVDIHEENSDETIINKEYRDFGKFIGYEIKSDEFIKYLLDTNNTDYLYYLNKEQYECLVKPLPVIVAGSAGSGKTTVGIRKLINVNNFENNYERIAYFTYTNLLRDNSYDFFDKYKSNSGKKIKFYTINEYYMENLSIDKVNIFKYDDFRKWFENQKEFSSTLKDKSSLTIWAEIRGIVKGAMLSEWTRDYSLNSNIIDLLSYKKLSHKYSDFNEQEKDIIFKLTEKYNTWLKKEKKYDENDLALMIINEIKDDKKFDLIICDEVQDLTELQIYMLKNLVLNGTEIYFTGDVHQIVNPNYFSFGRLTNMFYSLNREIKVPIDNLIKNYRSHSKIVELANKLVEIRKREVGSYGAEDYIEEAVREGGKISLRKYNRIDIEQILKASEINSKFVVVVSDEDEARAIRKINTKARVFSVARIKGLEYEKVACINVISNNLQYLTSESRNLKRYYFNFFYVAITRATKDLYILEENTENYIYKEIEPLLSPRDNEIEIIIEKSTSKEWNKEGMNLEKMGLYIEAAEAYSKAGDRDEENAFTYYEKAGDVLINQNEYIAIEYYKKAETKKTTSDKKNILKNKIILCKGDYVEALKYFLDINNVKFQEICINKIDIERLNKKEKITINNLFFQAVEINISISNEFTKLIENMKKKNGTSILNWAIENGYTSVIKQLIAVNVELDLKDNKGNTALVCAIEKGYTEIAKELINAGINLNIKDNMGNTALMHASAKYDIKLVKELVKFDADLNLRNNIGRTALVCAIEKGYTEIAKELINAGAKLNMKDTNGQTLLITCIKSGKLKIAKELINAGAKLNMKDHAGYTALMYAKMKGYKEIETAILKAMEM